MTRRAQLRRAWTRLTSSNRGRVELGVFGLSVLVVVAVAAFEVAPAIADAGKLAGNPVPDDDVPAVVSAALACPILTPPRLAAQVMAVSGFKGTGEALTGLDDAAWDKWRPASDSSRSDAKANITALARLTCDTVGRLRASGVGGDLWQAAVAAEHDSVTAVQAAKGVPASGKDYVDKVVAYANWYADQTAFSVEATARALATGGATSVPADLIDEINAAGKRCPSVTPALVASELMAASGFNANLRSDAGSGIAQLSDAVWADYKPNATASVWKPADAIAALSEALCDISNQFSGLTGGDPATLAIAALQWGAEAVREANGVPRSNVGQLTDKVKSYLATYQADTRLTSRTATTTAPATSPTPAKPSTSASAGTGAVNTGTDPAKGAQTPAGTTTTTTSGQTTSTSTNNGLYDTAKTYRLKNVWSGAELELPGKDVGNLGSNTLVQLWNDPKGQDPVWRLKPVGGGYVTITNTFQTDLSLGIEDRRTDAAAKVAALTTDASDPNQQWLISSAGNGNLYFKNRGSGMMMDLDGKDPSAPNGTWNADVVAQYYQEDGAHDQFWQLVAN